MKIAYSNIAPAIQSQMAVVKSPSARAKGARAFIERFEAKQNRADEMTYAKEIAKIREVYPDWNLPK